MKTKNYNIIPLSIDQGLNAVQVGTAGGYIRLLDSPSSANVFIHLNEKNADPIPLKNYHAIEATGIEKFYVTCNAVPGEKITIVQANAAKDFKMITPASDVNLAALGSYESLALSQLDKIINPYQLPPIQTLIVSTESDLTTVLNKTLDSDKFFLNINSGYLDNGTSANILCYLDDILFFQERRNNSSDSKSEYSSKNQSIILKNVRGKTLKINGMNSGNRSFNISLEEYTLKQ